MIKFNLKLKLFLLTFALVSLSFLSANVYAESYKIDGKDFTDLTKDNGKYIISLSGTIIKYDAEKYGSVLNTELEGGGRTYVPVRLVSEKLGFQVSWDAVKEEVGIQGNGKNIRMQIGSKLIKEGNTGEILKEVELAIFVNNGRTYLPLRALGEALGYEVKYHGNASNYKSELSSRDAVVEFVGSEVKQVDEAGLIDGKYYDIQGEALRDMEAHYGKAELVNDFNGWGRMKYHLKDGKLEATFADENSVIYYDTLDKNLSIEDDGKSLYKGDGTVGNWEYKQGDNAKPACPFYHPRFDPLAIELSDKYAAKHTIVGGIKYFTGLNNGDDGNNIIVSFGRKDLSIVPTRWDDEYVMAHEIARDAIELFLQEDRDLAPKIYEEMERVWKTGDNVNSWVELRPGIEYRITDYNNKKVENPKMKLHIRLNRFWHD